MKRNLLALGLAAVFAMGLTGCRVKAPGTGAKETAAVSASAGVPSTVPTEVASNAPSATETLLMSFLEGESEAVVGDDFYNDLAYVCGGGLDGVERMSFRQLRDLVAESSFSEDGRQVTVSYAVLKTMGGREMLAVRFEDVTQDAPDLFNAYFIFGDFDGQVRLVYAEDYWSRSDTQLCQDLIFVGGGSAGAGDHYAWYGYIDDAGRYRSVYQMEILTGQWVAMYAYEIFDMDMDWAVDCECDILDTDEGKFYELLPGEDTDRTKLALLRTYLKNQGMTEIDSAQEAIAAAKDAHGLTDTPVFEDWIPWEVNP